MTPERLREIAEREAREHLRDFWRCNLVECYGDALTDEEIDKVLHMIRADARIPAPPRVIRTREDLADLDPDTVLAERRDAWGDTVLTAADWMKEWRDDTDDNPALVIIATGDHVRSARRALEEE